MGKFIILFLLIFCNRYVYSQVEKNENNDTVDQVVTKLFENVSNSDILHLFNTLNNYYNYTSDNEAIAYDNTSEKSSTVMKINPRTGRKYLESVTEPSSSTSPEVVSKLEWVSRPLREGLSNFRVKSPKNQACNLQSDMYEMHLKNNTLWAVRSEYSFFF